jgi:hypothetical protein
MKYLFYSLLIVLFPSSFYRFYILKGESPLSLPLLFKIAISAILATMAFWSHWIASPPTDPGYLKWETFRTDAELEEKEDKMKWQDPDYVARK